MYESNANNKVYNAIAVDRWSLADIADEIEMSSTSSMTAYKHCQPQMLGSCVTTSSLSSQHYQWAWFRVIPHAICTMALETRCFTREEMKTSAAPFTDNDVYLESSDCIRRLATRIAACQLDIAQLIFSLCDIRFSVRGVCSHIANTQTKRRQYTTHSYQSVDKLILGQTNTIIQHSVDLYHLPRSHCRTIFRSAAILFKHQNRKKTKNPSSISKIRNSCIQEIYFLFNISAFKRSILRTYDCELLQTGNH